jgi:endonuclease/exonuclease/phosphatase family metal-dependent hydrolase
MSLIRVMTFNILGATYDGEDASPEERANPWPTRAALNVRTIKRYAPDLIGFQEVQQENLALYQEELADYNHIAGLEEECGNSIFWKKTRFELIESGEFWLSRTPDQRSADWGVPYPLTVTWVKLRCRETGLPLLHMNTQFEDGPDGVLSRPESSKLMAARVAQMQADGSPAVVTGDFNCNPWHPPYRIFMRHGFVDTYRAAGHGDSADSSTFHGLRGAGYFGLEWGGEVFWRVDWILTRDGAQQLQTTSCTIVRDAEPPVYPSDHYPVVAEVLLVDA